MAEYIANFELNKNSLEFQGELSQNKLQANLVITTKDKHYTYEQATPSKEWVIEHNLNKKPSITVVDSADNVIIGDYQYDTLNTVTLRFNEPFIGKAYFN